MGMTAETFERVYGHHHPDYQRAVSEAVGNARQKGDRNRATEREQSLLKVVKIIDNH
jgi:hypothetical protein